jgi:hypothetical protein
MGGEYAANASALDRMRKQRNRTEYDIWHVPQNTLERDLDHAKRLVTAVDELLEASS